ncbi:MAG: hypothetical protein AAF665_02585 [Pseudomonadota bacterium]
MDIEHHNALWRAASFRAKISRYLANLAQKLLWSRSAGLRHLPPISDHIARDIGLSAADLEWSRLKLPSQHCHHPRS